MTASALSIYTKDTFNTVLRCIVIRKNLTERTHSHKRAAMSEMFRLHALKHVCVCVMACTVGLEVTLVVKIITMSFPPLLVGPIMRLVLTPHYY